MKRRWSVTRLLRKGGMLLAALASACLIAGCWDEVNLQDVSYVSAIGIDYKDGKFNLYGQLIKFAQVAKNESPEQKPSPVWIGKGTGDTALLALHDMTRGGQASINIEQLKTIVVHERALGRLDEALDGLNRQRAARYTTWLFGTKDPIEDIFNSETFFDQSPINSILYTPLPHEAQYTFIRPREMQLAVQTLKEPAMTTKLPVLKLSEAYWKQGKKPMKIQIVSGVFVFKELKYKGYFPEDSIKGLRWTDPDFKHFMVEAAGDRGKATVGVKSSRDKLRVVFEGGRPKFAMTVRLKGDVAELDGNIGKAEIAASIERQVKEQIEDAYATGLARELDLLDLEHHLYRYHHSKWKRLAASGEWLPRADQLTVDVKFELTHSGKFDLTTGQLEE
ncbi:Ger(x)C family spore germination protein [Paenibacillus arenilitoris]|uniref:Ger(X)C family spore germination protein n=1 Tax=Paenibacillus arenilitoris TaxID=2772299 RepID=A0A927H3P4_9BACL|nr:Ger(x)C family spore germination protein [Paenibacillus arenilitoris]MBD2867556.1 Ger(x)C family spore germination protein [Paenibacillus arenilitoris]